MQSFREKAACESKSQKMLTSDLMIVVNSILETKEVVERPQEPFVRTRPEDNGDATYTFEFF